MPRLAVVVSHPIQYYSPWFRHLAQQSDLILQVFYLWDFGITTRHDPGFGHALQWDIPLLEGYAHVFVSNRAVNPGSHHWRGLNNPGLVEAVLAWQPDALLLFGYAYRSHLTLLLDPRLWRLPILHRGDSHALCPRRGLRPQLTRLLRRLLFRRFAAVLAVGQANAAWLAGSGVPTDRIVIAPHAVDNARFRSAHAAAAVEAAQQRDALGIPATAPVVLFAGKFEAKKRPLDLLLAFAALGHPTARLVFVGAGVLDAELRHQAARLAPERVILLGFQNQSAMPGIYALGDLLVLPSYGPGETWGLCVNEAMNLARPAIVSSHVGCGPDLVLPGRTGWIFPAGDSAALTAVLADALADPQRLRAMGEAAQAHVGQFSYARASQGLRQALHQVLA